mmetsp:Transcript_4890/g.9789  ORF Transcript_4890/g.9789 Transcript_4890/m.9789 type:complete len:277 (+) Transcript_4890:1815-2645(+)
MRDGSRLSAVGPEGQSSHPSGHQKFVQGPDVAVHVVGPIRVGGVVGGGPLVRFGQLSSLGCVLGGNALVIHGVKPDQLLQQEEDVLVRCRIPDGFKQGLEDIPQQIAEILDDAHLLVHVVETGDLDQPADLFSCHFVFMEPATQLCPLVFFPSVNGDPHFRELIFLIFKIIQDFFCDLGKESAVNVVVCLQEDVPKEPLPKWIVLVVEQIESLEAAAQSVHVQMVSRRLVGVETQVLSKNVRQLQALSVLLCDNGLGLGLVLFPDESQQVLLVHTS